jgi:hypothetical protein
MGAAVTISETKGESTENQADVQEIQGETDRQRMDK